PATTSPATTSPATTSPATTSPATTSPATTSPATTSTTNASFINTSSTTSPTNTLLPTFFETGPIIRMGGGAGRKCSGGGLTLHFDLQIGSGGKEGSLCQEATAPRDNVIVQVSTDGGLHWRTLMEVEPSMTVNRTRPFSLDLPAFARSRQTSVRWWQPDSLSMDPSVSATPLHSSASAPPTNDRAEWQLGWVQLLANDTLPHSLSGNQGAGSSQGEAQLTETWFMIHGGKEKQSLCYNETMIVFGGNTAQFVETWDVEATEATMVQFDLFGPCPLDSAPLSSQPPNLVSKKPAVPSYVAEQMLRDAPYPASPSVAVEYSTDEGTTWTFGREMCAPPDTTCTSYDHASVFQVPDEDGHVLRPKRRVMLEMPRTVAGNPLRVRMRSLNPPTGGSWGIANVFLGDACPWMCSGHGYCSEQGDCSCDVDYFSDVCVPAVVLPCELLDTFNSPDDSDGAGGRVFSPENFPTGSERIETAGRTSASWWWSVRGVRESVECGHIVGGAALVFAGEREREAVTIDMDMTSAQFLQFTIMLGCDPKPRTRSSRGGYYCLKLEQEREREAVTIDMDMTSAQFLQFTIMLGCDPKPRTRSSRGGVGRDPQEGEFYNAVGESWEAVGDERSLSQRDEGVLVQFSIDGGIGWELLKEIHFSPYTRPRFVNIDLRDFPRSQTNATRFRLWQPNHPAVEGRRSWAVDNLYIGGSPIVPNVLYEDFNGDRPISDAWIDWPGGHVGQLCSSGFESRKTLVYDALEPAGAGGERALYSRDVSVYGDSVLQFEIKIGCGKPVPSTHNISLQYSTDNGASWKSVKDIPQESGENYLPSLTETPRASWHRNQRTAGHSDFGARHEMQSDYSQQTNKNSYSHPLYPDYFNGAIVSGEDKIESESGKTTRKPQHRVSPDCLHELKAPSVYYWNSAPEWRREVIPLSNLQICGNVRFRWIELGDPSMPSLVWALDNIYLGPACIYHCGGHGLCINGDTCLCDEGYDEDASCLPLSGNPSSFRLSFDNSTASSQHQVHQQVLQVHQKMEQVQRVSGGHVTTDCSVIRGAALVFREDGERSLVTHNLDTSDGSMKPACGHTDPVLAFEGSSGPQFAESPDLVGAPDSVLQFLATTMCLPHTPICHGG
ncbi:EGF-like domain, partial [Trinorchestia longiramus]